VRKPRHLVVDAGGVPPAQVIGEPVDRFPVAAAFQALQHHHHRQDRRRHRPAAVLHVQVGEQLIGEQPVALGVQQPVDRPLRQLRLTAGHRHVAQPALAFGQPQRHPTLHQESYTGVILPGQGISSESAPPPRGTTFLAAVAVPRPASQPRPRRTWLPATSPPKLPGGHPTRRESFGAMPAVRLMDVGNHGGVILADRHRARSCGMYRYGDVRHPGRAMANTEGFEEFYAGAVGRLLGQLLPVTGDLHEAEEVVQEAFARASVRWAWLRDYDVPEAWVRRVALNLAAERARRLRRQARALLRLGPPPQVPAASAEALALLEALRTLPMRQRQAIVLYHLVDLPVEEVAGMIGVRPGTVKSLLARGRRALANRLSDAEEVLNPDDQPA
jgi:RNA polymerase sigma-70 factor (ECF subfamily)